MVLADLGRKITTALKSLGNATIINEDVSRTGNDLFYCNKILDLILFGGKWIFGGQRMQEFIQREYVNFVVPLLQLCALGKTKTHNLKVTLKT